MVEDFQKIKKELASLKKKNKKKEGKKSFFKGKIVKKPQTKVPSVDPKKFITQGLQKPTLVREGRTGYFKQEMIKEQKWLS